MHREGRSEQNFRARQVDGDWAYHSNQQQQHQDQEARGGVIQNDPRRPSTLKSLKLISLSTTGGSCRNITTNLVFNDQSVGLQPESYCSYNTDFRRK